MEWCFTELGSTLGTPTVWPLPWRTGAWTNCPAWGRATRYSCEGSICTAAASLDSRLALWLRSVPASPPGGTAMSIAISVAALVFSLAAFQYGRWRDRRDLLLKIHEHLVSADQHRGRRLLFTMKETQIRVEDISEEDYLLINNALAALNVLGIYYRRRYIRRKDVLELWAVPVLRAVLAGQAIMARRDTENGMPIWPHL